ncbi:MAG: class I SAM-dependent methyltransferase [Bacteroidetes bacterium]|nr:class I SAM-dependent methyltransferase [Bacteroidota bacterium]MCL2303459.1 class I SAM-dependent methyltransferase [Lentimicrobiaceae bacterium]
MDIKEFQAGQLLETEANHPWEMARFTVVNDIISKHLPKRKIVGLDLGCGDIYFLDQFAKKHAGAYYAVDIAFTKDIIEELHSKYQNPNITLYNSLEEINVGFKMDVVFVMDVIEHIDHPVDFIKTLISQKYIDENTLFLFTVPAYQSLFSNHDKWIGHVKRYTPKLLKREVSLAGLQTIHSGSFFATLLFPRLLTKITEKIKKADYEKSTGAGGWRHGKTITNCFKTILKTDYYIFGKFFKKIGIKIPGLSTYVVCKLNVNNE